MRKRNYRSEKTEMVLYPDSWWDGKSKLLQDLYLRRIMDRISRICGFGCS
jgi:hypothetical protein